MSKRKPSRPPPPEPAWVGIARHNFESGTRHAIEAANEGAWVSVVDALASAQRDAVRLLVRQLVTGTNTPLIAALEHIRDHCTSLSVADEDAPDDADDMRDIAKIARAALAQFRGES